MIHSCLVCVCVRVYHLNSCKTSSYRRGMWHSCPTTRNEAVGMSGKGNVAGFLYLLIYLLLSHGSVTCIAHSRVVVFHLYCCGDGG